MPRSTFVVAAIALCLTAVRPAAAQVTGWANKQFTLERIDADTVRLVGQVEVEGEGPNAGQKLAADEAIWNTTTGELKAQGNVLLVTPTSRLSAERVEFNTKTKLGKFFTASGIGDLGTRGQEDITMFGSLEPDVYFYGEVIEKVGEDRYKITRGGFTSCVQPTPRWEVVSSSATINLNDWAILRNAVMHVKDVPVFYLPWMYFPIQDDARATGFLMPTYGNSTLQGQSLSNAFFWAVDRSQDVTMMHDWYGSRGSGYGGEYRYIASPQSGGDLRIYRLNTEQSVVEGRDNPARKSFEVRGNLAQRLPAGLRARGRVDYFSDITTQQLYNQNPYMATLSQRLIQGNVSGAWGGVSLSGNYQRAEQFFSTEASVINGYAPSVQSALSSRRLGPLPVYFSVNGEAARVLYISRQDTRGVIEEVDNSIGRVDFTPSLRAPLTNLPYLNLNTTLSYRYTYYTESLENNRQVEVPLTRRYAEMRAELVGPVFSKVFNPTASGSRMKHIIEPNFSIQRTTAIDNANQVVNLGVIYDRVIGNVTRFSYGVTNRLMVRSGQTPTAAAGAAAAGTAAPGTAAAGTAAGTGAGAAPAARPAGASSPREALAVTVVQSYYTDELASTLDQQYQSAFGVRPPSKFSPVQVTVRANPTRLTTTSVRMEYDHEETQIQGLSVQGGLNSPQAQVAIGWSRRRIFGVCPSPPDPLRPCNDQTFNTNTTLRSTGGRFGGTFSMDWDVGRGTVVQQRYIGFYSAQCCGFNIEYQVYNYPTTFIVPQNRRFNFSFTLAGIGTFSNFFGAFGGNTGAR